MVKLRSGKSYLDRNYFNKKIDNFNILISFITNTLKANNYKTYLKNLTYKSPDIYKDFNKIIHLKPYLTTYKGTKGGKYFILNRKKYYLTSNNSNNYLRNEKLEEISLLISKFINNYEGIIKSGKQIEHKYAELCSICYSEIKKGEKIVVCRNRTMNINTGQCVNMIIHPYHKTCFDTNLQFANVPYLNKTKSNGDVFKLYECPYCRQKKININNVYTVA